MIFRTFDGDLRLAIHRPERDAERAGGVPARLETPTA
jgi:hypothetical protein